MRWNEGTNVCSDSTLTIEQAEAKPKSAASTKGSSILIAIDKTTQKMLVFYRWDQEIRLARIDRSARLFDALWDLHCHVHE
jgi:hypothetical protein